MQLKHDFDTYLLVTDLSTEIVLVVQGFGINFTMNFPFTPCYYYESFLFIDLMGKAKSVIKVGQLTCQAGHVYHNFWFE